MVGIELKAVIVILIIASLIFNFITYKEVWTNNKLMDKFKEDWIEVKYEKI